MEAISWLHDPAALSPKKYLKVGLRDDLESMERGESLVTARK
jgi:hypothetical protein